MFGKIAPDYDRGNAIMSCNRHHKWNQALVEKVLAEKDVEELLDLCCGTGEVIRHFGKLAPNLRKVSGVDFCPQMLTVAKEKFIEAKHVSFTEGDAQDIPLESTSVDAVTISYGIRNVKDTERCITECHRVLRPGGVLGILELTLPQNPLLAIFHKFYLRSILPSIGGLFSKDPKAYSYLAKSIQAFTPPKELGHMIEQVGFTELKVTPLMGGISHIFIAKKL
jgi:demethylmenaquinone methyltransferase/2-methoxy-6-polyprenyl-1,4-benzoquinol methylase